MSYEQESMSRIVITGSAGFIGYYVTQKCLQQGHQVLGIDNLSDYYDVNLKQSRLDILEKSSDFNFERQNISEVAPTLALIKDFEPEYIIHLAAQAGVRYSIENPFAYTDANLVGFTTILEAARHNNVKHLVYASSSSVYGANKAQPFSEQQNLNHPMSLYAASKKANELMAHSYASLYQLPTTGLRFFTAYGPWGRPDMALFLFTKAILAGEPIDVFNHGKMVRDFTYVTDVSQAVYDVLHYIPKGREDWDGYVADPSFSYAPYQVFNVGRGEPVQLSAYIEAIEAALDKKALYNMLPMQPGDVPATAADISALQKAIGYQPKVSVKQGVAEFIDWYLSYYA
jgi:UDP-glucuronate 4-epimerase